jgi:ferredoxin
MEDAPQFVFDRSSLTTLIDALHRRGYEIVGPTVRDGAIVYDTLASIDDLPAGWTDEQGPGSYRLKRRDDADLFSYAVGPHSWKRRLFPPRERLWSATRTRDGFDLRAEPRDERPLALLGVRACELAAIAIQDRVFLPAGGPEDAPYASRRRRAFIVAVHCGAPAATCFCASTGTGPRAAPGSGFDLALTELPGRFVAEIGSEIGAEVLRDVPHRPASDDDRRAALEVTETAAARQTRALEPHDPRELFAHALEAPRWDQVAARCLGCANCTLVCPTCFCHTVEDVSDLTGEHAERWRRWDSCFGLEFSRLHAGHVRASVRSRYRQWLTHKLGYWLDQFGVSGCTGCGRCIAWCPAGIDLTEELRALRETAVAPARERRP